MQEHCSRCSLWGSLQTSNKFWYYHMSSCLQGKECRSIHASKEGLNMEAGMWKFLELRDAEVYEFYHRPFIDPQPRMGSTYFVTHNCFWVDIPLHYGTVLFRNNLPSSSWMKSDNHCCMQILQGVCILRTCWDFSLHTFWAYPQVCDLLFQPIRHHVDDKQYWNLIVFLILKIMTSKNYL